MLIHPQAKLCSICPICPIPGSSRRWNTPGRLLFTMGYVPPPHIPMYARCAWQCTCDTLWLSVCFFRTPCQFTGPAFTPTDSWSSWVRPYSGSSIVRWRMTRPPDATTPQSSIFVPYSDQSFCLSALRGASSKRKKGSLYAGKSASQEALSPTKEEKKEEKKAQSMEQLDAHCEHRTALFVSWWFGGWQTAGKFFLTWLKMLCFAAAYSFPTQSDLQPRSVSFDIAQDGADELDNRWRR